MSTAAVLLMLLCPAPGKGEAAQSDERIEQLPRLLRQLDDDRLVVREAAEAAITDMGPSVMDHLPPADQFASPEARERMARIWQVLETQSARQFVQPSRVSLAGEFRAPDAFQAIEEQTGNRLAGYEEVAGSVALQFDEVPFWQAVDQLMDQCQLTRHLFSSLPGALNLQPRSAGRAPRTGGACYRGIFRISASQVTAVRDLRDPGNAGLRVRLTIEWEPRITPISLSVPIETLAATDSQDVAIAQLDRRGTLEAAVTDDFSLVEIDVPLQLPDRRSQQIRTLSGELRALIPGRVEAFSFAAREGREQPSQRIAGATVTLARIVRNKDVFQVHVRLRFEDAADALESYRGWYRRNEAYLVDGEGNRMENDGMQILSQAASELQVAYSFARAGWPEDGRFVYETPVLLISSVVPFELRDLDLP